MKTICSQCNKPILKPQLDYLHFGLATGRLPETPIHKKCKAKLLKPI